MKNNRQPFLLLFITLFQVHIPVQPAPTKTLQTDSTTLSKATEDETRLPDTIVLATKQYNTLTWETFAEWLIDGVTTDDETSTNNINLLLDDLQQLHEHPFNLNKATQTQLRQLPFLPPDVTENILTYLHYYGPMRTEGELFLIEGLDQTMRQALLLFAYIDKADYNQKTLHTTHPHTQHELSARTDIPLYTRVGFTTTPQQGGYTGSKPSYTLRYSFTKSDKLTLGFTADKDSGEPMWKHGQHGFDLYKIYAILQNIGKLKTIALGDYRINVAEGLVLNNGTYFSKWATLNTAKQQTRIRQSSTLNSSDALRGIATTIQWGPTEITAFVSHRKLDATLSDNSTVTTINTQGYHRTLTELQRKNNLSQTTTGTDITYTRQKYQAGITAIFTHYNKTFQTGTQLYRQYYPTGRNFTNLSAHYTWQIHRYTLAGETAWSSNYNAWATLNRLTVVINGHLRLLALQRLYTYQYVAPLANAFSEGGNVKNESGFYLGMETTPTKSLKITAFADYFYFPWAKYATPHTSQGFETVIQTQWQPTTTTNLSTTYRIKRKERYGQPYLYHKLQTQLTLNPHPRWQLKTTARYANVKDINTARQNTQHAWMINQTTKHTFTKQKITITLTTAYFHSNDYKIPMTVYEPTVLQTFGFLTLYNQGIRCSTLLRWDTNKHLTLMAKYGNTTYLHQNTISTGMAQINTNYKNDLTFYLRIRI